MTTHDWKASATAQKQSNYGRYKAGIHRGEGRTFETVNIIADSPELALEIARKATVASKLTKAAKEVMGLLQKHGKEIVPHLLDTDENAGQRLRDAIAEAEGSS